MAYDIRRLLILLTLVANVQLATFKTKGKLEEGDFCKLRNGTKGVCQLLYDCCGFPGDEDDDDDDDDKQKFPECYKRPLLCAQTDGPNLLICCNTEDETAFGFTDVGPFDSLESNETTDSYEIEPPSRPPRLLRVVPSLLECDEYSRWVSIPSFSLSGKKKWIPGDCAYNGPLIEGNASEAEPLEFPHMAHLGFSIDGDDLKWACGGSLISEQFVLTAAHCVEPTATVKHRITHVKLGTSNPQSLQIVKVAELISYPGYTEKTQYDDIGLVRLAEKIVFDNYKRPACLQVDRYFQQKLGVASGWGKTSNKRENASEKLLKVNLPFITNEECRKIYKAFSTLASSIDDETQICAGGIELDTCQGDSGGPLQIMLKNPSCMYSIVGITSFGKTNCGEAPGVFTRVSGYIHWIEEEVWRSY